MSELKIYKLNLQIYFLNFVKAADWIKEKAGPTIREKFDDTKKTLQDPKTHEKVQDWVEDEAIPVVKEKFEQFKVK